MAKSCNFYSSLPGFKLVYGGAAAPFTTFDVGQDIKMSINLELSAGSYEDYNRDFGRVIFHTEDVDSLYHFMQEDNTISGLAKIENKPSDAPWGERFFHLRDPDGYQLSFAQPIIREAKRQASVKEDQD